MKYSYKEKQKHFNDLGNPDAAEADLVLLAQKKPDLPELKQFARAPHRYANDILYRLLDFAEREEVRHFRREHLEPAQSEGEQTDPPADENPKVNTGAEVVQNPADITLPSATQSEGEQTNPPAEGTPTLEELEELRKEKEEAEERADEAESALEEAESNLEETEAALEEEQEARVEAEERAKQAVTALEEEKKKELTTAPPVEKSKSTKSTRRLTGTTSKTPTSK